MCHSDLCPGTWEGTSQEIYPVPYSPYSPWNPALPHFHRERKRRGCLGQRDCAKLCASSLQNLPETCWKTFRKKGLLKATLTRLCRRCWSCSVWHNQRLSCCPALGSSAGWGRGKAARSGWGWEIQKSWGFLVLALILDGQLGPQSPGEHMCSSTESRFSLQWAFVPLRGSKARTSLTTITLQKT